MITTVYTIRELACYIGNLLASFSLAVQISNDSTTNRKSCIVTALAFILESDIELVAN